MKFTWHLKRAERVHERRVFTFPYLDALPHRRIYANLITLVATAASTICASQALRRGKCIALLALQWRFFMVFHFFKSKFPPTITDVLCWRQSNDDNDWIADAHFFSFFGFVSNFPKKDYAACTALCALHWIDFNSTEWRRERERVIEMDRGGWNRMNIMNGKYVAIRWCSKSNIDWLRVSRKL